MSLTSAAPAVLALGSNLAHRLSHLRRAATHLERSLGTLAVSSVYESKPIGYANQGDFLNAVALAWTPMGPEDLLFLIRELEEEAGRERTHPDGPRTLDVDLILLGERIVREPHLTVPHPRWKERSFVILPLEEIAPDLRDPETGWTVRELARKWPMEPEDTRIVAEGARTLLQTPKEGM